MVLRWPFCCWLPQVRSSFSCGKRSSPRRLPIRNNRHEQAHGCRGACRFVPDRRCKARSRPSATCSATAIRSRTRSSSSARSTARARRRSSSAKGPLARHEPPVHAIARRPRGRAVVDQSGELRVRDMRHGQRGLRLQKTGGSKYAIIPVSSNEGDPKEPI